MARKLSRPIKDMGLKPSHFITLRTREKITGINTNMRNPAKLGRIKEKPTNVFLAVNE
jgi:hypothetical protein